MTAKLQLRSSHSRPPQLLPERGSQLRPFRRDSLPANRSINVGLCSWLARGTAGRAAASIVVSASSRIHTACHSATCASGTPQADRYTAVVCHVLGRLSRFKSRLTVLAETRPPERRLTS